MAVQMTRAEYEKKYGTSAPVANAPVKMTRAEYEATYGSQEPQQQDGFVRSLAKDALKTLVVKPAVRFGQAIGAPVAQALGADPAKLEQELARPTDVNIPLLGNIRVEGQKGLDSGGRMQILGDAAKQASYLAPYGRIAQGVSRVAAPVLGKAAGLAGGVVSGALGGYSADVGNQIEAGDENPFRPSVGTAIGAALPIAGAAIGKGVTKVASMTPKAKMQGMAQELSSVKNALEENTRNGISPIDTLTKNKYIPEVANGKIDTTAAHQKIADAIDNLATSNRGAIDDFANRGAVVNLNKFADDLFTTIKSNPYIKASGKVSKVLAQAQNMIDDYRLSYGENVPVTAIDDIRKAMNRVFDPEHYDVERAFGNAARSVIYDMVPNARETLRKEAELIAAQDFLKSLHGKAIKGGKLGRYFGDIVGAIAGSKLDGGVLGPLAGVAANRGLNAVRGATYFSENPLAGAASKAQGVKLQSLGDAFLDTNMGKAVTKSLKNPSVGLSIKDVSKGGVPSAGTKSSKPSTVTNTSTSNVPTERGGVSVPKTDTSGGFDGGFIKEIDSIVKNTSDPNFSPRYYLDTVAEESSGFSPSVLEKIKSSNGVQRIGTVGDAIAFPELKAMFSKETLDTPIYTMAANSNAAARAFTEDVKNLSIGIQSADVFSQSRAQTLWEEILHIEQAVKGRKADFSQPYDKRPHEITAKKGASFYSKQGRELAQKSIDNYRKPKTATSGGVKGVPIKETRENLKYDSSKLKKSTFFRASSSEFDPSMVKKSGKGVGIYITNKESYARSFLDDVDAKNAGQERFMETFTLKDDAKIISRSELPEQFIWDYEGGTLTVEGLKKIGGPQALQDKIASWALKNGYDVIDYTDNGQNTIVVNPSILKKTKNK